MGRVEAPTGLGTLRAMRCLLAAAGRALVLVLLVATFAGSAAAAAGVAGPGSAAPEGGVSGPVAVASDDGFDLDADPATADVVVEILPLSGGFVDPPVAAHIADVIARAGTEGSDLVVLQISSGGGVSVDVDGLVDTVRSSPVPVAVLIGPLGRGAEARGAAALLWLAADVRAVSSDATVGPVRPADLADDAYPEHERSAELVAEADGDEALVEALLEGPVDAASLEAAGVVTVVAEGLEPLLLELDGREVVVGGQVRQLTIRGEELAVRFHSLGLVRRLLHAATTAPFIYLLLVAGLVLLAFEVFQPGFGVAGIAGSVTAGIGVFGVFVLPVAWWALALVVLGIVLYTIDTAIAGFGPLTFGATAALAVGSVNMYTSSVLALPWWLVAGTTLAAFVFFTFAMTSILRAQAGPEGVSPDELVGRPGVVRSVLNPEGYVYVDGALWRARWTGESRRAKVGTAVHAVDGPVVLVGPLLTSGSSVATADVETES